MRAEGNASLPLRLVVSGGIGSGKSTVLRVLEDLGVDVIEADRVGHSVLEPGGGAFESVVSTWPEVVQAGRIDRGMLATIVFEDIGQLRTLESITHPQIAAEIQRQVDGLGFRDIAVELPLASDLLGDGWIRVVVDAPVETRRQRAAGRGFSDLDVSRRMSAQPTRHQWLTGADVVLDNSGSISDLESRVAALLDRLRSGA